MGRVWALAGGFVVALLIIFIAGPLGGPETMLTGSVGIGSGLAAVYLSPTGQHLLARGTWLFVGCLCGSLSFVLGGLIFPDTIVGLFLGGVVPILVIALLTMWTKRQADFLAGILGAGTLTGVYANVFFVDPQGMNISLPIGLGQSLLPLGLGFIVGLLVARFTPDDAQKDAVAEAEAIAKAEVSS
jgi:hypothetical protein